MWLRSSPPRCTPARSPTTGRRRLIAVATSSRHLADGDERLTDPPGEQPLQPEQRYQRFVPAQRSGGNEPAAQHATGDPPSRHAGQVEILEMTEAEPSRLPGRIRARADTRERPPTLPACAPRRHTRNAGGAPRPRRPSRTTGGDPTGVTLPGLRRAGSTAPAGTAPGARAPLHPPVSP